MNLIKTISFNKIKNISIENSIIKINNTNEIENEFSVKTIQKIYLKARKQNLHLIYIILIALISAIIIFYLSLILVLGMLFILIISMVITKYSLNQKKYFLCIKFIGNNNVYSIPFNIKRKDEILNVIWEIRRQLFEANVATI